MSPTRPPQPPPALAPFPARGGARLNSPPASARSRKASTACLACKQRKSKCNEGHPCEACQLRQSPCVYDRNADQRRRTASQKNTQEFDRQRMVLGGLLAIIQSGRPEQTEYLFNLIRSAAELPHLAAYIENALNADPELFQLSQQIMHSVEEQSQSPGGASRAYEERLGPQLLLLPPISVSAPPWTTIASNEVASHLLSLYFTWEQPCLQFVDKGAFLTDMKAGEVSQPDGFCSPLLVSALLAQACLISQRTECKSLRARFLGEAKARLELERGKASITTLQALVVLSLHEGASGRDRVGRAYYLQAMDMFRRLGLDQDKSRPAECEASAAARLTWKATTVVAWGVFCVQNFMSFLTGFEPTLPAPRMEKFFEFYAGDEGTDLDSRDGSWSPYPMQRPEQPAFAGNYLSALCSLSQIHQEISGWNSNRPARAALGSPPDVTFRMQAFQELTKWEAQLDPHLKPGARSMAHTYYLNNFYHAIHLVLFRPLQEFPDVRLPVGMGTPRELCFQHASESMEMTWAYRRAFSLRHGSCAGLLGPCMAVFTLPPQLQDGPQKAEPFVRACQALAEQSENYAVAPYLLAMLKVLDMEHKLGAPEEARPILDQYRMQLEGMEDIPMEMQYPTSPRPGVLSDSSAGLGGIESESVGDLLGRWAAFPSQEPAQ